MNISIDESETLVVADSIEIKLKDGSSIWIFAGDEFVPNSVKISCSASTVRGPLRIMPETPNGVYVRVDREMGEYNEQQRKKRYEGR